MASDENDTQPQATPAPALAAHEQSAVHKTWTLVAVCMAMFMLILDVTIVVVALPSIRSDLHTSFADVQWTIDAYSLSLASLLLPTGSLADLLGRRRVFAGGLVIFTLGSLLCGIATSGTELIVFRAFQGIGGATLMATSLALLAQTFHGRERAVAFGIWGGVVGAAGGLGPLVGGFLTTDINWRWIFFVNVPLGIFALIVVLARVREFKPDRARRIDTAGFVVFTAGLFCLVYGLIESSRRGWSDSLVIGSLICGGVLLAAFPLVEHFRAQPMFDVRLFKVPTFLGGSIAAFGMNGSIYAMFLYITIYFENVLHLSPLDAGLRLAVSTLAAMIVAVPAGRFSAHIPLRWLIGPGLLLCGVGLLLMGGLSAGSGWTHLLPGLIVGGLGSGMVNPGLASTAVGVVEPQDSGMASGMNSTFRQVGIATAIATYGSIYANKLASAHGVLDGRTIAHALNPLFMISGIVALVAAVAATVLIRPQDFLAHHHAAAPEDESAVSAITAPTPGESADPTSCQPTPEPAG